MEDMTRKTAELVAQLGKDNSLLLLRVMQSFWGLKDLLLKYCEYAQAFSDVATEALNRRLLLNNSYRNGGCFASVLYTVDSANGICRMDFDGEGNGVFAIRFAVGESEEDEMFQLALEQGVSLDYVHLMLETLWNVHANLYEQLTAVSEGYGHFIVEPKKPN